MSGRPTYGPAKPARTIARLARLDARSRREALRRLPWSRMTPEQRQEALRVAHG